MDDEAILHDLAVFFLVTFYLWLGGFLFTCSVWMGSCGFHRHLSSLSNVSATAGAEVVIKDFFLWLKTSADMVSQQSF